MKKKLLISAGVLAVLGVIALVVLYNMDWGNRESMAKPSEINEVSQKVSTETGIEINDMTELSGTFRNNPDSTKAEILFSADGLKETGGAFEDFEVTLAMGPDLASSKIILVIQAASVNTENEMRDEHLREEDFFHASKHPEIRFESERITLEEGGYAAHGKFTMRGITKQMKVPFTYEGRGTDEKGNPFASFRGTMDIDQFDHGMTDESNAESKVKGQFYLEMIPAQP